MNLIRCGSGHFYDGDKFQKCPHCNKDLDPFKIWDDVQDLYGPPPDAELYGPPGFGEEPIRLPDWNFPPHSDPNANRNDYNNMPVIKPVVGWLVLLTGTEKGMSLPLHAGRNFIGRGRNLDISLPNDDKRVCQGKHAEIIFDQKDCVFYAVPGETKELYYVNDTVVLRERRLEANDRIHIGKTELIFVPLCSEHFSWNEKDYEIEILF